MTSIVVDHSAPIPFDVESLRCDFPVLARHVYGKPLVFLDSAASAQKPMAGLDVMRHVYEHTYANVHRGLYHLSETTTAAYEAVRGKVSGFMNAASEKEIIFTRGATESLNLIAQSYGRHVLKAGDEVILSELEHHSNIVPWQLLRDDKGIVLKVVPILDDGSFDMATFEGLLTERTRIVSIAHVSNVLGTVLPVQDICAKAHKVGAVVVVDGCQGAVHSRVDVQGLGCDFYVFSAHKLYGPTGVGVLWGRECLLEAMPPWQGGGDMISSVTFEKSVWADLPAKFEAGTPPIVEVIGLGAAIDYVTGIGIGTIHAHEQDILVYAAQAVEGIEGVKIFGTRPGKCGIVSFSMQGVHPHDIATVLDRHGVCVRAGHHCAQPLMDRFGVPALTRASFGMYTNRSDIDALVFGLRKARSLLV